MGTKFVIGDEQIDIPRGVIIPKEGEIILIKKKGSSATYIVDSVSHSVDFSINIPLSKTLINLKEIEEIEE